MNTRPTPNSTVTSLRTRGILILLDNKKEHSTPAFTNKLNLGHKLNKKMKTIRYQMMSLALALLAVGCNDDEIAPDRHPANTGDEVQFGVALPGADTRTIYGEETETGFPVYWVNEDKVKVASPQCNIKEAEYQVTVNSAAQNYADNLTKTGDAGIQWGNPRRRISIPSIHPKAQLSNLPETRSRLNCLWTPRNTPASRTRERPITRSPRT